MPRKRDPNAVVDDFQRLLDESVRTFVVVYKRVNLDGPLSKQLSIDAFMRAAVGWEEFRSDWHIAAINCDASILSGAIRTAAQAALGGTRLYSRARRYVAVSLPKHPTLEQVRELVDPSDRNVNFAEGWVQRASRELASAYRARVVGLTSDDHALIGAVVAIRNCIAYRSPSAITAMNKALARAPTPLRRGNRRIRTSGLGSHLWATPRGANNNDSRVEIYHSRLRDIAERLRIPS